LANCVEKLENSCLANVAHRRFQPLQGPVESIRGPAIVFAAIDVVPQLAARKTHQVLEFSVISEKGLFQHNRREADVEVSLTVQKKLI
jgi:hypothetical protein